VVLLIYKQSLKTWKADAFKSLAESKEVYKQSLMLRNKQSLMLRNKQSLMLRNKQSLKTWKADAFKSLAESKEVYEKRNLEALYPNHHFPRHS